MPVKEPRKEASQSESTTNIPGSFDSQLQYMLWFNLDNVLFPLGSVVALVGCSTQAPVPTGQGSAGDRGSSSILSQRQCVEGY